MKMHKLWPRRPSKTKTPTTNGSKSMSQMFSTCQPKKILPGDTLIVTATYFEPLVYAQGKYMLRISSTINPQVIPPGLYLSQLLSFQVVLNAGVTNSLIEVPSHPTICPERTDYRIVLQGNHSIDWMNQDIFLSYSAWSPVITPSLLVEPPNNENYDPRLSFLLFLSPPQTPDGLGYFGRSVVFLLDRSGSMSGDPMQQAIKSVLFGLDHLRPQDMFTIIAFDDQQLCFSQQLVPANPEAIGAAKHWVSGITARGGTDIQAPLYQALQILAAYPQAIPFVFLITDGAVNNERDICRYILGSRTPARICTFGIGPYCNAYFLKMLALLGRGFSDVALNPELIFSQISRLFEKAQAPALTNVEVGVKSGKCEIYPFPIPDLFIGAPLVIAGKYETNVLDAVIVRGTLPNGTVWTQSVVPIVGHQVPVNKVFVKQRLDLMTAQSWLEEDMQLRKQIIEMSVHESMPSAHTCMVAYETTPEKKAKGSKERSKQSSGHRKEIVAGLAVGGILVLGVAMTQFGDVAATLGNLSILDAMNLGDLAGGLGDLASGIGEGIGNAAEGVGDALSGDCSCCGDCCGGIGDCFGGIGDCLGGCFGGIGDCCGAFSDACGDGCCSVFDALGDGCEGISGVLCCLLDLLD
eukprot:TRINITY_DN2303_c0_g1_i10.p1 TRINITY_DN2303_c0_g1~~TRINITY_DN2303_c0_g1_i10.p1  ORF type:complete len:636 (+),score=128.96 TRINITY_DN2303_c0_g1_i10:389-2296(+)